LGPDRLACVVVNLDRAVLRVIAPPEVEPRRVGLFLDGRRLLLGTMLEGPDEAPHAPHAPALAELKQDVSRGREQGHVADRGLALHVASDPDAGALAVEVDTLPAEREQRALSEAGVDRRDERRARGEIERGARRYRLDLLEREERPRGVPREPLR